MAAASASAAAAGEAASLSSLPFDAALQRSWNRVVEQERQQEEQQRARMLEFRRMEEAVISRARQQLPSPPPPPPLRLPTAAPSSYSSVSAFPSSSSAEQQRCQLAHGIGRQRGTHFAASSTNTALPAQLLSYDRQYEDEDEAYTVAPPVSNSGAASALPVALEDFLDVNHLVQLTEEFERDFSAEQQRQEDDALPVEERIRRWRDREAERAAAEAAAAEQQRAQANRQRTEQGQRAASEDGSPQSAEDEAARRALEAQTADAQLEADEAAWMGQSTEAVALHGQPGSRSRMLMRTDLIVSHFTLALCTSSTC
jgi:hypothetical protein